jgi:hypothetical protein
MFGFVITYFVGITMAAAIGLWVGIAITRQSANPSDRQILPAANNRNDLTIRNLRVSRALGTRLATHGNRLCDLAKEAAIAPELLAAIKQVCDAVSELNGVLSSLDQAAPPKVAALQAPPSPPSPRATTLTRQEMITLTQEAAPEQKNEFSPSQRYQFSCSQLAAPWSLDEPLPSSDEFQRVKCRDISAGGISFLWPDKPDFENVVIAIGPVDSPIYMIAKIVHSRAVYMFDEVGYLVGCKFTKRLEPATGSNLNEVEDSSLALTP